MSPDSSLNVTFEWVKPIYTNIEGQVEEKVCTSKTKLPRAGFILYQLKVKYTPKLTEKIPHQAKKSSLQVYCGWNNYRKETWTNSGLDRHIQTSKLKKATC